MELFCGIETRNGKDKLSHENKAFYDKETQGFFIFV